MKTPDISVFVGQNFDVEFLHDSGDYYVGELVGIGGINTNGTEEGWIVQYHDQFGDALDACRPRLNHKQVLDDYSWLPDGFVWTVSYIRVRNQREHWWNIVKQGCTSKEVREAFEEEIFFVTWVKCIGVTPEFKEWGESVGLPVIEPSGGR